jgi:hypothetical protein
VCVYTDWFFSIIGIPEEAWGEALPWAFLCARNDRKVGEKVLFIYFFQIASKIEEYYLLGYDAV